MSVVLNEAGVQALFHSPDMHAMLARRAEAVVRLAREDVRNRILARTPLGGQVAGAIDWQFREEPLASEAVVGIRDEGSRARYLAHKETREGGVWLLPAFRKVFPA